MWGQCVLLSLLASSSLLLAQLIAPSPGCLPEPTDIVFVVDQSDTISSDWALLRNFISNIINITSASQTGVHYGLVTFNSQANVAFSLTQSYDKLDLISKVQNLPQGSGSRNTQGGLSLMRTMYTTRPDVRHVAVLITDGRPNDMTAAVRESQLAYADGIEVYAIGLSNVLTELDMISLSSPPQIVYQNYWQEGDYLALGDIVWDLQNQFCNPPKSNYQPCETLELAFAIPQPTRVEDMNYMKKFLKSYIASLLTISATEVRVAVITYTYDSAVEAIPLNKFTNEADLAQAIDAIPFKAEPLTLPERALDLTVNNVLSLAKSRQNVQRTLVLMLDGELRNLNDAVLASQRVQINGIRVIPIDMTSKIPVTQLNSIATKSSDVIKVPEYRQLMTKLQPLATIMCGAGSEFTCPKKADVVLLLDQSTSIVAAAGGYSNWNDYIIGFVLKVVEAYPITPDLTHVGLLKFSTSVAFQSIINLNKYYTSAELRSAIRSLQLEGGETNIYQALNVGRTQLFSPQNGARSDVPKIMILLTDGKANREAEKTIPEANATKNAGIKIFTIGITSSIDVQQLRAISSDEHFYYVQDFSKLDTVLQDIIGTSCSFANTVATTTRKKKKVPTATLR